MEPTACHVGTEESGLFVDTTDLPESRVLRSDWPDCYHANVAGPCFHAHLFTEFGIRQPYALAASQSDPDLFSFDQAMKREDWKEWIEAMKLEIKQLEDHGTWQEVDISEAEKAGVTVVPMLWVLRFKRNPAGDITKRKARATIRGDLEKGDFETASPVVAWSTVRIFLILSMTLGWTTVSCDFSNAFVQATLDRPVFMHIPRGFRGAGEGRRCLKLIKSIYGLSSAPLCWANHLFEAFKKLGLIQSKHDECLWFKDGMMVVCYVDDAGIAAKDPKDIDKFIEDLEKLGFTLTKENSFSEYLGIKFEHNEQEGRIKMTQTGLIKKVLAAAKMEDCNPAKTPARPECVGLDPDGMVMKESWSYRSIVGMLLYLATNTRPDIAFAVSQVARFNHDPKQSHASAVKIILRYLKGTMDQGTTVTMKCIPS